MVGLSVHLSHQNLNRLLVSLHPEVFHLPGQFSHLALHLSQFSPQTGIPAPLAHPVDSPDQILNRLPSSVGTPREGAMRNHQNAAQIKARTSEAVQASAAPVVTVWFSTVTVVVVEDNWTVR